MTRECSNILKANKCDHSCRGKDGIMCLLSVCSFKPILDEDYKNLMSSRSEIDTSRCK